MNLHHTTIAWAEKTLRAAKIRQFFKNHKNKKNKLRHNNYAKTRYWECRGDFTTAQLKSCAYETFKRIYPTIEREEVKEIFIK